MAEFYRRMVKREIHPIQALREAKLAVRGGEGFSLLRGVVRTTVEESAEDRWSHPFFWAPFIYIGLPAGAGAEVGEEAMTAR